MLRAPRPAHLPGRGASLLPSPEDVDMGMLARPPLARRRIPAEPAAALGAGAGLEAGGRWPDATLEEGWLAAPGTLLGSSG